MKNLYLAIKARLEARVPTIKFIALFNNQLKRNEQGKNYSFPYPAVFVEFIFPAPHQLLNGNQIYEPLEVKLHIALNILNTAGTQDEVLQIMDMKQLIYAALTKFHPDYSSPFIRGVETVPSDHNQVTVYYMSFITALFDVSQDTPTAAIESVPPVALQLNVDVDRIPD